MAQSDSTGRLDFAGTVTVASGGEGFAHARGAYPYYRDQPWRCHDPLRSGRQYRAHLESVFQHDAVVVRATEVSVL